MSSGILKEYPWILKFLEVLILNAYSIAFGWHSDAFISTEITVVLILLKALWICGKEALITVV